MLNPIVQKQIDSVALGIIEEQERTGKAMSPVQIAATIVAFSLYEAAGWLQDTLDKDREERYDTSLILLNEASQIDGT